MHNRLAENQPMAGLSSLNEYENGMGKSETELVLFARYFAYLKICVTMRGKQNIFLNHNINMIVFFLF